MEQQKPKVRLAGEDGNAFSILGRCRRAMSLAGYTQKQWEEFEKEAKSGDYDNLLRTVMKWFDHDSDEEEGET
jgi:hypothetical protein